MLQFLIFAVAVIIFLLVALFLLYPGKPKRACSVPGLEPSDEKTGNLADIRDSGSLHQFLMNLHKTYGDIAGFYWGSTFVVASSDLKAFKQQINLLNKPKDIYEELLAPFLGQNSLFFLNNNEVRYLRSCLDRCFDESHFKQKYDPILNNTVNKMVEKWSTFDQSKHIPLRQYMLAVVLQNVTKILFGDFFDNNDDGLLNFARNFDICWTELEARLVESGTPLDDLRMEKFEIARKSISDEIIQIFQRRMEDSSNFSMDQKLFIDELLEIDDNLTDEQSISLCLDYLFFIFHPTADLLTWFFYYLIKNPKYESKILAELSKNGIDQFDFSAIGKLKFLNQFIQETLRFSNLIDWVAKSVNISTKIGEFSIPPETPIIQSLGVACLDENRFIETDEFNPDRFEEEDLLKDFEFLQSPLIGFPGQRKCPAEKLVYAVVYSTVIPLVKKYRFSFVDENQANVAPFYGLVTRPAEEIFIGISAR